MSEEKNVSKPRQLWDSALRAVKGGGTEQLVETFTAEMTLVAEGLCEDQTALRREVAQVRELAERIEQRAGNERELADSALREHQREVDRRLEEMARRISALEHRLKSREDEKKKDKGWISQLTVLAGIIAGAWVIVTVLHLLG